MNGFESARRAAVMQDLLSHLFKRPVDLLPFDAVRERLHLSRVVDRGVQEVPLERIVGTVQRSREFNRAFLPREDALRERWQDLEEMAEGSPGFPPVELYRVGDVDFVVDGHHRVSVAQAKGAPTIEARVKEFLTGVPLPSDTSLEDLLRKEGLARFLEATGLSPRTRDEFQVTEPNGYERLLDHITVHRFYRGVDLQRPVSWEQAVASWYGSVYRPMVETIRTSRILEQFPGRTETDLYLFTMDHLHHLRSRYGPKFPFSRAVRHFELTLRPRGGPLRRLQLWLKARREARRTDSSEGL